MKWTAPFVVLRGHKSGEYTEVFQTDDLKKAKYWLTYIAEIGDVLCKTPFHNRHSGDSEKPEYWSHKTRKGSIINDRDEWVEKLPRGMTVQFPDEPEKDSNSYL